MARRRSCGKCGRTKRSESTVHRLLRSGQLHGQRLPANIVLNDSPGPISPTEWRLRIGGAVANPMRLRYEEIASDAEITATLDCTGGWHSTQAWRGIALADLLEMAQLDENANSVTVRSVTGYYRKFSITEANSYIIATQVGDELLSHGHGFSS